MQAWPSARPSYGNPLTIWVALVLRRAVRLRLEQRLAGGSVSRDHLLGGRQLLLVLPTALQQPGASKLDGLACAIERRFCPCSYVNLVGITS
jgi:hypothetical protein